MLQKSLIPTILVLALVMGLTTIAGAAGLMPGGMMAASGLAGDTIVNLGDPDAPNDTWTCPGGGNGFGLQTGLSQGPMIETAADLLGMTVDEIMDLHTEGLSLAEIAATKGVTVDELVDYLISFRAEFLAEKVADGTLTSEQADAILESMRERMTERVQDTAIGPFGNGRGQGRGGYCWQNNSDDANGNSNGSENTNAWQRNLRRGGCGGRRGG